MTVPAPKFCVEPLAKHDRGGFSCGVEALDRYLKQQAGQDLRRNAAAVFVLVAEGGRIAGYYTLSSAALKGDDLPAELLDQLKLPRYPELPATLIGRLAVDSAFRGQRLGEYLLMDALERARRARREVASLGVLVDAKDDSARAFYLRYGFRMCADNEQRLFLPMATIDRVLG